MKKVLIAVLAVVLFTGCTIFKDSKPAAAPKAKAAVACPKAKVIPICNLKTSNVYYLHYFMEVACDRDNNLQKSNTSK